MPARFQFVLVEPGENRNIGSVARSLMNFGFDSLSVVAPKKFDAGKAKITACWAEGLVDRIQHQSTLSEGIHSADEVIGFSARMGKNRGEVLSLREWLDQQQHSRFRKTALLFGPEDTGLRNEHVERCTNLVSIPTHPQYPSLNLAQAVTIVAYELSQLSPPAADRPAGEEFATGEHFTQLDRMIERVGEFSGFFGKGTPQPVPGVLRNLLRRTRPTLREMGILLGYIGNIERVFEGKVPLHRKHDPAQASDSHKNDSGK